MVKKWYQQKTFWTCVAGLITIAGTYVTGEVSMQQAGVAALLFISQIFQRMGTTK